VSGAPDRIVVIDHRSRAIVRGTVVEAWGARVRLESQDGGRTLKVWITDPPNTFDTPPRDASATNPKDPHYPMACPGPLHDWTGRFTKPQSWACRRCGLIARSLPL
jgi:hypothetical protein